MASPVLHIKDAYFFEVPKFLWRANFRSLDEVPQFLRDAHPHATLAEFNKDLSGIIMIPQPFGVQKNLYEMQSGFGISKFMIIQLVIALLLVALFSWLGRKIATGQAPKGKLWNMFEAALLYIRDNMARPAIGEHDADRFLPVLWTMFFFILFCNLFGMLPWLGAPTGSFAVTLALAGVTFSTTLVSGMIKFGPVGFWLNQVPHMDLPLALQPLKLVIFLIEVLGLFIKHGILAVRLLANMVAGHLVIVGIMAMIAVMAAKSTPEWALATVVTVVGCTLFNLLELLVAFLQAYIFTFLSALFIGAAVHHH